MASLSTKAVEPRGGGQQEKEPTRATIPTTDVPVSAGVNHNGNKPPVSTKDHTLTSILTAGSATSDIVATATTRSMTVNYCRNIGRMWRWWTRIRDI